jgi:hypothetical protein
MHDTDRRMEMSYTNEIDDGFVNKPLSHCQINTHPSKLHFDPATVHTHLPLVLKAQTHTAMPLCSRAQQAAMPRQTRQRLPARFVEGLDRRRSLPFSIGGKDRSIRLGWTSCSG